MLFIRTTKLFMFQGTFYAKQLFLGVRITPHYFELSQASPGSCPGTGFTRRCEAQMPPAEPARRCLSPQSNSGTLRSYEWHFKVLKSASRLRSYLAMTLSPSPLTKLALGDNCRGFATIHNQQQRKYNSICCIQLAVGEQVGKDRVSPSHSRC